MIVIIACFKVAWQILFGMRTSHFFLTLFLSSFGFAQPYQSPDSLRLTGEVSCVCQNFKDETYLGLTSGEIIKLDHTGKIDQQFSYPNMSEVTHISCSNPLKIMSYHQDNQSYLLLERFNTNPRLYPITPNPNQRIEYATLAPDQSLWMITTLGMELIRRDVVGNEILLYQLATLMDENENILGINDVGNQLVIRTDQQLMSFNLAGQLIGKYLLENSSNAYLLKESLFIPKKNGVTSYSIQGKMITEINLPKDYQWVIELKSTILLINEDQLYWIPR